MPTITHFEIPADNVDRAKSFYTELFGWKIEKCEGDFDYWMIDTGEENNEKKVCGGMMVRQNPQQPITNYMDVSSVDEYIIKTEKLGGKIVVPKTAVPNFGYFAVCLDTENNSFGFWENDKEAK